MIKFLLLGMILHCPLYAEEITEWRQMTFSVPTIHFAFQITTCATRNIAGKNTVWSGNIDPYYSVIEGKNTFEKWYWGNCSIETLKYAHKLTDKTKSAKVESEYWQPDQEKIDTNVPPKYMFIVCNDVNKGYGKSYEGYLTEEEFITLANMLLEDVRSAKTKRGGVVNTAQVEGFIEYFTKKLDELSKLKKSAN